MPSRKSRTTSEITGLPLPTRCSPATRLTSSASPRKHHRLPRGLLKTLRSSVTQKTRRLRDNITTLEPALTLHGYTESVEGLLDGQHPSAAESSERIEAATGPTPNEELPELRVTDLKVVEGCRGNWFSGPVGRGVKRPVPQHRDGDSGDQGEREEGTESAKKAENITDKAGDVEGQEGAFEVLVVAIAWSGLVVCGITVLGMVVLGKGQTS